MQKILVIGRQGQLANECALTLSTLGQVMCAGRNDVDVTRPAQVRDLISSFKPHFIVNASAYTAVDKAESEPDAAKALNVDAVSMLAECSKQAAIPLIHYSTDYVFDGGGVQPWKEDDSPSPQGVYARTKLAGEQAIMASGCSYFIFRTAWVYGHFGANFYKTMRRLAREREELRIVSDQMGSPTWSFMIASATAQIIAQGIYAAAETHLQGHEFFRERSGLYHLTAAGACSWYDFAREIVATDPRSDLHRCRTVTPISTAEYPTPAKRPAYSVLDSGKCLSTFGVRLPDWKEQLAMVQNQVRLLS